MKYSSKERYYRLKSKGFCVKCGSEKAVPGMVRCEKCRIKANECARRYQKRIRIEAEWFKKNKMECLKNG